MSEQARYYRVGLFVLLGAALIVGAILVIGGTDFLKNPVTFETYFAESVQGLEVGSSVKLRGVRLGSVSEIGFVADHYDFATPDEELKYGQIVLVRVKMRPREEATPIDLGGRTLRQEVQSMIDHGLRVRLAQQGVTGTAYIEADYASPEDNPPMEIAWTPEKLYVPSMPSTLKSISNAVERLFARLNATPVEDVVTHLDELLVNLNRTVEAVEVARFQGDLRQLVAELRQVAKSTQRALDEVDVAALSVRLNAALDELEAAAATVRVTVEQGRPGLDALLDNLRIVSEDLRDLAATARKYPSVLLLGEPPARTEPARGR